MKQRARFATVLAVVLTAGWHGAPSGAAAQPSEPALEAVSALRCWRRVDRGAVRIGEQFGMTVTCRVVESGSGRAVPDTVGLEPESIDLLPFEVLAGERFADVNGPGHRFFQYHYVLRLTGEDYFGRDVPIPPLELNYRIERPAEAGTVLPGRELTYVLPGESIRVLSLVPETAADIRGIPLETLGAAEARLARADVLLLAAAGLGLVAAGVLVVGLRRAHQARQAASSPEARPVAAAAVAGAVARELTDIRRENAEAEWSPERIGRGLAALRLAAAVALDRPVAERDAAADASPRPGELRVRCGPLARRWVMVSSAVTPPLLAAGAEGRQGGGISAGDLERLQRALAVFSMARYARPGEPPPEGLTLALEDGIEVSRQLRVRALAPLRRARRLAAATRGNWQQLWAR